MTYKFTGKGLLYAAAVICFITVILLPFGILFIIAARNAEIRFENGEFVYRMFTTKRILFSDIKKIEALTPVEARYKIGYTMPTFATVVPLKVTYGDNKSVRFSLNYFEKPDEIVKILQEKAGLKLEIPE